MRKLKKVLNFSVYLLVVLVITLLIVRFVGQRSEVIGTSMEPTFSDGDNLILEKISYRFHDPKRFDVIVFPYQYEKNTNYIKRIIGLPGETVYIDENGQIFINDEPLIEHYGNEIIKDPGLAGIKIYLLDDEYFVLGDNRNDSVDSRSISVGNIKRNQIIGRAFIRIYPFSRFGKYE